MLRPALSTAILPNPANGVDSPGLAAALETLGGQIRRGGRPEEAAARLATGLAPIDAQLGGGIPRGRLSELSGPDSSGRTALAVSLLAGVTRSGAVAAFVDLADAFDAASAAACGVELSQVLWVRAPRLRAALRATERLLEATGLPLVVLDLPALTPAQTRDLDGAAWPRLARAAAASNTAFVVLSPERHSGVWAGLALSLASGDAHFTNAPVLLEGRDVIVHVARARTGRTDFSSATDSFPDRAQHARANGVRIRLAAPAA